MFRRALNPSHGLRRGGMLLEIVLGIALFTGAASFTLASVRSVFQTLHQARLRQAAIDLARSKLSELEAGLINLADLQSGEPNQTGSVDLGDPAQAAPLAWRLAVTTQRSEYTGLSLVEITVEQAGNVENPMRYTLRQLVALGAEGRFGDPEGNVGSETGTP